MSPSVVAVEAERRGPTYDDLWHALVQASETMRLASKEFRGLSDRERLLLLRQSVRVAVIAGNAAGATLTTAPTQQVAA